MSRWFPLRTVLLFLVICAFGAVDAVVKGHHGGTRNAIGNVSAPWLLVPFLSAVWLRPRRLRFGALVGAASTTAALVSYFVIRAVGGFDVGTRSQPGGGALVTSFGNRWFLLGITGGSVLGALGSWLVVRQRRVAVAAVIASALAMEPVARMIWATARGEAARTLVPSPAVWTVEVICGCAVWVACCLQAIRHR